MKIISFSLWGNKKMYSVGAIENIKLAREIYPGWQCRFYVDDTVPISMVNDIKREGGEIKIINTKRGAFWGMFWRFMANDDPLVDVFISRDCDSRLNYREKAAVDEWINSDKYLHTMHDHYAHRSVPILGGMWGLKKGGYNNLTKRIDLWNKYDRKGIDQYFLWANIWPALHKSCMRHVGHPSFGEWGTSKPFPKHQSLRFGGSYVGEIFDENNKAIKS